MSEVERQGGGLLLPFLYVFYHVFVCLANTHMWKVSLSDPHVHVMAPFYTSYSNKNRLYKLKIPFSSSPQFQLLLMSWGFKKFMINFL